MDETPWKITLKSHSVELFWRVNYTAFRLAVAINSLISTAWRNEILPVFPNTPNPGHFHSLPASQLLWSAPSATAVSLLHGNWHGPGLCHQHRAQQWVEMSTAGALLCLLHSCPMVGHAEITNSAELPEALSPSPYGESICLMDIRHIYIYIYMIYKHTSYMYDSH